MATEAKKVTSKTSSRASGATPRDTGTPATKKKESSGENNAKGKVKVTQVIGSIARRDDQRATLIGLGLNKRHRSRVLEDTPSVRGMIYKVRHLLVVEKVS